MISRVEIADRLNLERSTITHQVNRLLDIGLVTEISEGRSGPNGGRRPIHLSINKDYGFIIGIEMQVETYTVVAVNLNGELLFARKAEKRISGETFLDDVVSIARSAAFELGGVERLLGVGVGIAGIIDSDRGIILRSIPLRLSAPLDFAGAIGEREEIPFLIGNDANCCAWGELAFHKADGLKNFLFALVYFLAANADHRECSGTGFGLGIVIDGKVYTGSDYTAGEFRSAFWNGGERDQFSISFEDMGRLPGDKELLDRFVREYSRNLAVLANTFNMNKVFIGGDIENEDIDAPGILREEIDRNWMYPKSARCEVSYSSLGEKAVAYGAAGMLIYRIFTSTHLTVEAGEDRDPLVRALHL